MRQELIKSRTDLICCCLEQVNFSFLLSSHSFSPRSDFWTRLSHNLCATDSRLSPLPVLTFVVYVLLPHCLFWVSAISILWYRDMTTLTNTSISMIVILACMTVIIFPNNWTNHCGSCSDVHYNSLWFNIGFLQRKRLGCFTEKSQHYYWHSSVNGFAL